ncbi:MAG: DUF4886 domain-containing protein [Clostridiales bacterium]|nr:DUF4886 domain-containing protein [Clostridiales bacterium]
MKEIIFHKKRFRRILATALSALLTVGAAAGLPQRTAAVEEPAERSLKVLAIGNSFSEDAMQHLYQIAADAGATEIVLGNLYIGGCSLATHWGNAQDNRPAYEYKKNTNGTWSSRGGSTMEYGIKDEEWDLITIQQVSGLSGMADTYNSDIENLASYIRQTRLNRRGRLGWHMTWAYQTGSNHGDFPKYGRDQMTMYNAIVSAVQQKILTSDSFDLVIPSGTAIQNMRTSYIGDTLTRDGYHLSYNLGRYIAGLTWLKAVTGWSIDEIAYVPSMSEIPASLLPVIKQAVNNAVEHPFTVTPSSYVNDPVFDDLYKRLDWEPEGTGYWNSGNGGYAAEPTVNRAAGNSKNFIPSARRFTKADIPVGSIIEVDEGYQYRPDGWAPEGAEAPGRPENITARQMVVDKAFWDKYEYRAFNLAAVDGSDLTGKEDEAAAHLRIYVPDLVKYTQLDWEYICPAFWNSDGGGYAADPKPATTGDLAKRYVASAKRFTKEDIPVGSVLVVDPGYQYRPDGWAPEGGGAPGRPDNVSTRQVVVGDDFWSKYEYRAFNISIQGSNADLTDQAEEVAGHFRIYTRKAGGKAIQSFSINGAEGAFSGNVITVALDEGTDLTKLTPEIVCSDGASLSPASGVQTDFTNPVRYTVTAEDGTTQIYIVTIQLKKVYDYSKYDLLDWEPAGLAYWNSGDGAYSENPSLNATADNSKYFVSSGRRFTKADIPAGSLLVIDAGYQYRPEGWGYAGAEKPGRPGNVTVGVTEVGADFWENYEYRAFNVAVVGNNTDLTGKEEETAAHFRIYIPKSAAKDVLSFSIDGVQATIIGDRISLTLPGGTDLTKLAPVVTVSDKASVSPASGVQTDFTQPVVYTVTAEDGSVQTYTVTVTVKLDSIPGDMDGNGEVTIQDVMEACKVLARQSAGKAPAEDEMLRGNLDGDDKFTITDVMEICKILARKA